MLKRIYARLIAVNSETSHILRQVWECLPAGKRGAVLDVGCGYGRILRPLAEQGVDAVGVDANPNTVNRNRSEGLSCLTPAELAASGRRFRAIVMAHVIEHMTADQLLVFLEDHLEKLEDPGYLVIASPTIASPYFYDDFDHVRPYSSASLLMVFSGQDMQTRHRSRFRLALNDICYCRSPLRISNARSVQLRTPLRFAVYAANALNALLFLLTFGLIGQTTSWVGRFVVSRTVSAST